MPIYLVNSREYRLLSEISGNLAVELKNGKTSISEVKTIISNSTHGIRAQGVINDLCDNGFAKIIDNTFYLNNYKGGEKMQTYETRMTSGETKVAQAVISHFEKGLKLRSPKREVFENFLIAAFPKIKNGKAATTNLINKGWLKEVDGKIVIGEKGEKYLSP